MTTPVTYPDDAILTVEEAAAMMRVQPAVIYEAVRSGELPAWKPRRSILMECGEVRKFFRRMAGVTR